MTDRRFLHPNLVDLGYTVIKEIPDETTIAELDAWYSRANLRIRQRLSGQIEGMPLSKAEALLVQAIVDQRRARILAKLSE